MPKFEQGFVTKQRKLPGISGNATAFIRQWVDVNGNKSVNTLQDARLPYKYLGSEITRSEGHPWPPKKGSGLGDIGGAFFNQKQRVSTADARSTSTSGWVSPYAFQVNQYHGPLLAIGPNAAGQFPFPPAQVSSDAQLDAYGATAIANCKPDNAILSASSAVGEILTGGLPSLIGSSLWKDRTNRLREAGDEYLNVQFGWRPLINDLNKFVQTIKHADAVLSQYERDAGKVVRRSYEFPPETSRETVDVGQASVFSLLGNASTLGTLGTRTLYRSVTRKRWFSGAFTYHLPSGYDSRNELDRIRLLAERLGAEPSPQTIWELAPWSWAVDWFSNAGDVVSNIQSFEIDGSVLAYGYLMEHTIAKDIYTHQGARLTNGQPVGISPVVLTTETKVRVPATPYGFGVDWNGLSSFQVSILTALGLTKGRR